MTANARRPLAIILGLVGVLAVAGWGIWSNERILAEGQVVRLELAPVDPRSLMQGDYMVLNYAVADALRSANGTSTGPSAARADGFAVLQVDAQRVGRLARIAPTLTEAAPGENEVALRYRVRDRGVRVATNAFFFQEGLEPVFRDARYGEFRVGGNGEPRLVALLDARLGRLGDNRF